VGSVFKVDPCTLTIHTSGTLANGLTNMLDATLTFGTTTSTASKVPVIINGNGSVTINGVTVGTVTVNPVTGAGG
jgi:hypothetical protein